MNTTSIKNRKSKVSIEALAPIPEPLPLSFLDRFPDILAGKDLKEIIEAIIYAWDNGRPVILTFGAHVIKCGLSNIICELIRNKMVDCIATNGASIVHDVELSLFGHTSEDVDTALAAGKFGNTKETIEFINNSINNLTTVPASQNSIYCPSTGLYKINPPLGIGEAIGISLCAATVEHQGIFRSAYRYNIPACVHVALGTDIWHMYTSTRGDLIGTASMRDFGTFVKAVSTLGGGGVLLNFGSAVIMPEVILKAIALNRIDGMDFTGCVMADFDMNRQYRSMTRIVETAKNIGGRGYHITIQHEIILPLLGGLLAGAIRT